MDAALPRGKVVILRRPAEDRFDAFCLRDERGWIPGAAAGNPHIEIDARDLLDDIDDLEDGEAFAVAAITNKALAALAKIIERHEMPAGSLESAT